MIQVPTLTVFVSMRWTMWMRTSCRLLLITSRKNYRVADNEANAIAHLSILEAWSQNDPYYVDEHNTAALSMDNGLRLSIVHGLTRPVTNKGTGARNASMKDLINGGYFRSFKPCGSYII